MCDQIECCPHCDSARFRANSQSPPGRTAAAKYRCQDCHESFETPATRDRRAAGAPTHGAAATLADPDVSEPADLDGGEA